MRGKHRAIKLIPGQESRQYNGESNECDIKERVSICFCKGKSRLVKLESFEGLSKLVDKARLADTVSLDFKKII